MTTRTKSMRRTQSEAEQPTGFRIGSDGEVEMLTRAETDAIIRRAIYEAMVRAGFRIRRSEQLLH
jgi:hypothetical protein